MLSLTAVIGTGIIDNYFRLIKSDFMLQQINDQYAEVLEAPKYLPCISLIMPFEPKMNLKVELAHKLKIAADKIENELLDNYTEARAMPVIKKLREVLKDLNYNTHKKSIAIFVSSVIQKVYYLDLPVGEKIIIDDSFEIRDLIYSKKEIHKYLLVVLSSKWTKIFIGNTTQFIRIVSNVPANTAAYKKDLPQKVANFSDETKIKEIHLDKFLRQTDNGLSFLLKTYKLPLFVMGTSKTIGHFKAITHNAKHVIDYIPGNFEEKTEPELQHIMKPYVADWKKIIQNDLLKQIDEAMNYKKLAIGINEARKSAMQKKGRLLVLEKNYMYPVKQDVNSEIILRHDESRKYAFYNKDVVDDVIERVLGGGGDVEFVDEGLLYKFDKIVLIEYYSGR